MCWNHTIPILMFYNQDNTDMVVRFGNEEIALKDRHQFSLMGKFIVHLN